MASSGTRILAFVNRFSLRSRMALFFALLAIVAIAVLGAALLLLRAATAEGGETGPFFIVYGGGAGFLLILAITLVGVLFDINVAAPIQRLVRDMETALHGGSGQTIDSRPGRYLGRLPGVVRDMSGQLQSLEREMDRRVAAKTARLADRTRRLEDVLHDLHQGIVICNAEHQIMLYNRRALELLHVSGDLGLGRSLFSVANRQPVLHAVEELTNRFGDGRHAGMPQGLSTPLITTTADGRFTLQGRLSLMIAEDESFGGYIVTLEDRAHDLVSLGRRERRLRESGDTMRQAVQSLQASLAAAVESKTVPTPAVDKARRDLKTIGAALEAMMEEYTDIVAGLWPMADVDSADLFACVASRLVDEPGIELTVAGTAQQFYGDSYLLVELLDPLVAMIARQTQASAFFLEASAGEGVVNLDVIWLGEPVAKAVLYDWADQALTDTPGQLAPNDILDHHKSSFQFPERPAGEACIRLALPPGQALPGPAIVPDSRPEFYDFALLDSPAPVRRHNGAPLRSLPFVVFDTETTGLNPSGGDEIVSIAGVRLVNGRILSGEAFSRIVHPRRDIPPASTRFHGITDKIVEGKPPAVVVLPQFREFIEGAVLVAHNAAFDMTFLQLKEVECNVVFDNPVLDTLLLSILLHDDATEHDLDSIAERFGVAMKDRHTAMGDSLVTAGIFLRMIDMLEARGIRTLEEALAASREIAETRLPPADF